jgi:hypothetical protein
MPGLAKIGIVGEQILPGLANDTSHFGHVGGGAGVQVDFAHVAAVNHSLAEGIEKHYYRCV